MKIQIVFKPVDGSPDLVFVDVHDPDTGKSLSPETYGGEWAADGDWEALNLEVLPPLAATSLKIMEASGKPIPKPLYRAGDGWNGASLWPVLIRPVTRYMSEMNAGKVRTLGGPVAYTDTKEQAEELARILNEAIKPDPNEPVE